MLKLIPQLPGDWRISAMLYRLIFPLLLLATLLGGFGMENLRAHSAASTVQQQVATLAVLPGLHVLNETDKQHYRDAFTLQQSKHFSEADSALAQVSDALLKDALLAERNPSSNAVHETKSSGSKGFVGGYERSALSSDMGGDWSAGLASFRKHDMQAAATHFAALLDPKQDLSGDDRAAAAFWAYRSFLGAGDSKSAMQYAAIAADEEPSFYSMLARSVTGQEIRASQDASLDTVRSLMTLGAVRRAIAYKEINQEAHAEQELRALFLVSNDTDRKRLITLATLLDLPAAQMHMALALAHGSEEASDGLYPMPHWTPTAGYHVEPALLFAIMRQESGFNPNARSAAGAMGVMQLMPATAHAMARTQHVIGRSSLPSVSMTLGQSYLESLMDTPSIGDNLVFLTASYNAGPGTVSNWQRSLHYNDDPLLFVESIPYSETREYVLHVIGNYWVYSQLLGSTEGASLSALSAGKWPHYAGTDKQLTSMLTRLGADRIE